MAGTNAEGRTALWCTCASIVAFYVGDRWGMLASDSRDLIEGLTESLSPALAYEILLDPFALSLDTVPLICGLALFCLVWYAYSYLTPSSHEVRDGDEHGASRLGAVSDALAYRDRKDHTNNTILSRNVAVAIGRSPAVRRRLPSQNVLVYGPTGTGKTVGYVMPNILQLADRDVVVVDPKGQTLASCGHALAAAGFDIRVLNTKDPELSDRYNPLAQIRDYDDVTEFAKTLIDTTNAGRESRERIWDEGEALLYRAIITLLLDWFPAEDLTLRSVVALVDLVDVSESGKGAPSPLDLLFDEIATGYAWEPDAAAVPDAFAPSPNAGVDHRAGLVRVPSLMVRRDGLRPARVARPGGGHGTDDDEALRVWREFMSGSARTLKSFVVSSHARLAHITTPEVLDMLSGADGADELRLDLLGQREDDLGRPVPPRALFAVSSDFSPNLRPLVSILMWQCVRQTLRAADETATGSLPRHVSLILDEFKNIGRLEGFVEAISVVRSRNVDIEILLQTHSQLKEVYGDDAAKTIRGNCPAKVLLGGGADYDTARRVSEDLGKETTYKRESSTQRNGSGTSTSTSVHSLARDVLDPTEIASLPDDKALVMVGQEHPIIDDKAHVRDHPNYDPTYMSQDPERRFDHAAWRAAGRPRGEALAAWEHAWFECELPAREHERRMERELRRLQAGLVEARMRTPHDACRVAELEHGVKAARTSLDEARAAADSAHRTALTVAADAIERNREGQEAKDRARNDGHGRRHAAGRRHLLGR